MTFKDKEMTAEELLNWSGDTLMALNRYRVSRMTIKKIGGSDYLFVETGGFGTQNPAGWKSPFYVMKRH